MKRLTIILSFIICLLVSVTALTGCNEAKLVDFSNVTISVERDSEYTLPAARVYDENGNGYRVDYTVKTKGGEEVAVITNSFRISDANGYVITATANMGSTTQTRKITLNVIDGTAPKITINAPQQAFVSKEYTLPLYSVDNYSSDTLTFSEKLYIVDGDEKTEIAIENGKVTPTVAGDYLYEVTATDSKGNDGKASVDILVREYMGDYVFENFADEAGVVALKNYENGETFTPETWLESFDPTPEDPDNGDTRYGVGVMTAEGDPTKRGATFCVGFNECFRNVKFEYIYVKMYIKSKVGEYKTRCWIDPYGYQNVNQWVEFRIPASVLKYSERYFGEFTDIVTGYMHWLTSNTTDQWSNGHCMLFYLGNHEYTDGNGETVKDVASNYTFYVDEIGYKPSYAPVLENEKQYTLGETITLSSYISEPVDESEYTISYNVISPTGQTVQLNDNAFRLTEEGDYTVVAAFDHPTITAANYKTIQTYTINSYSPYRIEIVTAPYVDGSTIVIPDCKIYDKASESEVTNQATVTLSANYYGEIVDVTNKTITPEKNGVYEVEYNVVIDGLTVKTSTDVRFSPEEVIFAAANFEDESILEDISVVNRNANQTVTLSLISNPDLLPLGATHAAVEMVVNEHPYVYFNNLAEKSVYEEYDQISVMLKVTDSYSRNWIHFFNGEYQLNDFGSGVSYRYHYNEWFEVLIDIDIFLNAYDRLDFVERSSDNGVVASASQKNMSFMNVSGSNWSPNCKIAIYEIKAVKNDAYGNSTELVSLKTDTALTNLKFGKVVPTYVSATDVASDSNLPELPQGEDGYMKYDLRSADGSATDWGRIRFAPDCSYETFKSYDYFEFKVFATRANTESTNTYSFKVAPGGVSTVIGDVVFGEWVTIRCSTVGFSAKDVSMFTTGDRLTISGYDKFASDGVIMYMTSFKLVND